MILKHFAAYLKRRILRFLGTLGIIAGFLVVFFGLYALLDWYDHELAKMVLAGFLFLFVLFSYLHPKRETDAQYAARKQREKLQQEEEAEEEERQNIAAQQRLKDDELNGFSFEYSDRDGR